ncbi:WecB/TagA/CpsF family glycosyltransferase [Celeribacter sp.]|uniref:WecB/TagA/CpsF family glycosyltransferase n=1 Tax=Celeribacter sp. TaxID=1890673 RepID=UPI003A94C70D
MIEHQDFTAADTVDPSEYIQGDSRAVANVSFMGLEFAVAEQSDWQDLLHAKHETGFSYIVTPNVDHMVQIWQRPDLRTAYEAATYRVCDSRILDKLASLKGIALGPYPGSDMVHDLIASARKDGPRIAVLGPQIADFNELTLRYPNANFTHIDAPHMSVGSPEWAQTLRRVEAVDYDVLLICISFPKQELFALDLKRRGNTSGVGLCVGASIDFLTGRQTRAPKWVQERRLEWAYRLLSNPTRMWKRYLVDGPKIFWLFLRAA